MNVGWLFILISVFAVPLALDAFDRLTYFSSLTMWLLPVAYLLRLFLQITADGTGRRRRALAWTIGSIVFLGIVLDFVFGHAILRFEGCDAVPSPYVYCLPAIGSRIPVEELLFYALGPTAIVLVYACADEFWMDKYNPPDNLIDAQLIQPSRSLLVTATVAGVLIVGVWIVRGRPPVYAVFLAVGALLPTVFLYRYVHTLVNWPAFAATSLYVTLTSVVWEVTLAIPRDWWGYVGDGTLGMSIAGWSTPSSDFPVEAAFVWLCAPFSSILTYEFAKALTHHPRSTRHALFGIPAAQSGTQESGTIVR